MRNVYANRMARWACSRKTKGLELAMMATLSSFKGNCYFCGKIRRRKSDFRAFVPIYLQETPAWDRRKDTRLRQTDTPLQLSLPTNAHFPHGGNLSVRLVVIVGHSLQRRLLAAGTASEKGLAMVMYLHAIACVEIRFKCLFAKTTAGLVIHGNISGEHRHGGSVFYASHLGGQFANGSQRSTCGSRRGARAH